MTKANAVLGALLLVAGAAAYWVLVASRADEGFTHGSGWHGVDYRPAGGGDQPLLIVMDPGGDTASALGRYRLAADTHGWTLASTRAIYNGTDPDVDTQVLVSLIDAVAERHPIDTGAVYLAGFSGTGVQAYYSALLSPRVFAGAIAENAHPGGLRMMPSIPRGGAVYVFSRYEDFNSGPSKQLADLLAAAGVTTKFVQAPGGHEPMTPEQAVDAVEWFLE